MKQYNNKKKMMIMVLCVAIVLAGNMQASAMVTADDILAGRNATEVSSAQVVMAEGVVICNELVPTADVMMMILRGTGIILAVMSELELLVETGVYMPALALDPMPLSGLMAPVTPVQ